MRCWFHASRRGWSGQTEAWGGTITEATSWATVITTSPLFTLFHCLPHCHSHTARHTHMYKLKHSALRETERAVRAQLRSALTTTHSPGFSSLPSWATTSRRHSTNTESQCSHSHWQADSHMQAHDDTHILTLSSIHENQETKSNHMSDVCVRACWRFRWPAAQRLVFQLLRLEEPFPDPQKAFIHQRSAATKRRTTLHTEKATTGVMIQTVRRIRDYARAPKTVCSSADVRLSFQETNLSCSHWRRWSVDTCRCLLLLTRRLLVRAQGGFGDSGSSVWEAADVLVSKANPSKVYV